MGWWYYVMRATILSFLLFFLVQQSIAASNHHAVLDSIKRPQRSKVAIDSTGHLPRSDI
jgi:hypothetical protein